MLGAMNGSMVFLVLIVLVLNIVLNISLQVDNSLEEPGSNSSGIFSQVSLRQREYQEPNAGEDQIHNKDELKEEMKEEIKEEMKELLVQDFEIVLKEELKEEAKVMPQQVLQQNFTAAFDEGGELLRSLPGQGVRSAGRGAVRHTVYTFRTANHPDHAVHAFRTATPPDHAGHAFRTAATPADHAVHASRTAATPKYNTTSITIIQCWTGIMLPWMERVIDINEAYAKLHGYSYELLTSDSIVGAHESHMNKIKMLRNRLQLANSTDIVLYMDMDCMIWNQTVTVDTFPIDRYDFILSGLNSIFACSRCSASSA